MIPPFELLDSMNKRFLLAALCHKYEDLMATAVGSPESLLRSCEWTVLMRYISATY